MNKYQEIAQILDANAIQNTVDAYIKGRQDMEKELNAMGECEYNKGRQDAIDECISILEEIYGYAEKQTKYPQHDQYCNGIEDCIDVLEKLKDSK